MRSPGRRRRRRRRTPPSDLTLPPSLAFAGGGSDPSDGDGGAFPPRPRAVSLSPSGADRHGRGLAWGPSAAAVRCLVRAGGYCRHRAPPPSPPCQSWVVGGAVDTVMDEFDDNLESDGGPLSNNDELNYSDDAPTKYNIDEEDGQPSQPPNVRRSGRKRSTPQKLKSPVMSVKRGRKTAQGTHEQRSKNKAKKCLYNNEFTSCQYATIEYVNSFRPSEKMQSQDLFKEGLLNIPVEDMVCLTLPADDEDNQKHIPTNVIDVYAIHVLQPRFRDGSRMFCQGHYSFFFAQAHTHPEITIQSFIQSIAKEIFNHDMVFLPVNVNQGEFMKHWVLVMRTSKQEFQILDSLWDLRDYRDQIDNVIKGIASTAASISRLPHNVATWNLTQKHVPKQADGISCGLFIMKYMELWDGSKLQKKFVQDVDKFRKELAADLIFLEGNEIQEAKEAVQNIVNRNKY